MLPERFQFKVKQDCKAQFSVLKSLMNDPRITEIICATDADREGECIFRYVYNSSGCKKPVYRLWVSSLEDSAIRSAFGKLKPISCYNALFAAGYSRARADWLVGMNFSRLFTVRYNSLLPIGRVQTPTLAMLVTRDYKVNHFVKEQYFTVDVDFGSFIACSDRIDDIQYAQQLIAQVRAAGAAIAETVKSEKKTQNPPKLYDLTTLQREANKHYGFTADKTLKYLQELYEAKLATYPRTDCRYLPDDMKQTAEKVIQVVCNVFPAFNNIPENLSIDRCIDNSKITGHHAIIPTENAAKADLNALSEGQRKILFLISSKLILAASEPHIYEAATVVMKCADSQFTVRGKTVLQGGWKALDEQLFSLPKNEPTADDAKTLPVIEQGKSYIISGAVASSHWTTPPKPYTEDTLLSAMEHAGLDNYDEDAEKKGLGTPATRAAIIEALISHQLAQRKGKQILSTEKGRNLIKAVPPEVRSPKLTADWEMKLQDIEQGNYNSEQFMQEIKEFVISTCKRYSSLDSSLSFEKKPLGKCPKCGAEVKQGKFGYYCTGKCGMNIARVYNKELTEGQLSRLLAGQKVSFTVKGKKSTVLPQIEPFSYKNKEGKDISGFQWCCFLDDVLDKFKDHADPKYNL